MTKPELFNEPNEATYCPEDDKLRLYVGRVPREEYDALRAEGWQTTAKQDCDFSAVWTVERENTALSYAGEIGDEDQSPADRAADRAERFAGYREKRTDEATGHADRYDAGPSAHGFQNYGKAVRAADRHDRHATRATDAWSKAEYWQSRTAGVIANALYKSSPSVRMGRIKVLESELRRSNPEGRYGKHLALRLEYENQMLEAAGGRAASLEMEAGGWLGNHQIHKINKSPATGRVVSVELRYMSDCNQYGRPWSDGKGARMLSALIKTERLAKSVYRAPTDEERAAWNATQTATRKANAAEAKAKRDKGENCPLVNLTPEDALKLAELWGANGENESRARWGMKPIRAIAMTQATYSAASKGTYGRAETKEITGGGIIRKVSNYSQMSDFPAIAKVRTLGGCPVVISDKPQKALAAAVWSDPRPAVKLAVMARLDELAAIARRGHWSVIPEEAELFEDARRVGFAYFDSSCQFGLKGEAKEAAALRTVTA